MAEPATSSTPLACFNPRPCFLQASPCHSMAHSPDSWAWSAEEEPTSSWGSQADSEEGRTANGWGSDEEGEGPTFDDESAGSEGPAGRAEPAGAAEPAAHLGRGRPGPGGAGWRLDSGGGSGGGAQAVTDQRAGREEGNPSQACDGCSGPEPPAMPAHCGAAGWALDGAGGAGAAQGPEGLAGDAPGALHRAAEAGDEQRVRALLAAGAYVEQPTAPEEEDETPLHLAARKGHAGVVEALLAASADPHARNYYGDTPLMLAAGRARVACLPPLLAAGADIQVEDADGKGCLHHWANEAEKHPDSDQVLLTLRALLDAGCDAARDEPDCGTALERLLLQHLAYARAPGQPLTHVPEMVRWARPALHFREGGLGAAMPCIFTLRVSCDAIRRRSSLSS